MKKQLCFYIFLITISSKVIMAQKTDSLCAISKCFDCCRPDAYAPLGLMMTDHVHAKNEFSISYSYMNMQMKGNKSGASNISDDKIFENYMMSSDKMQMQMHMLMIMYGLTNKFTAMAMFSYSANKMNMIETNGMYMQGATETNKPTYSSSSGLGDVKFFALYNILNPCRHRLVAGAGLTIPTGSITLKGTTMLGNEQILPYVMQIGSGTYSFIPMLTYVSQHNEISWGVQAKAIFNIGLNTRGYAQGDQYAATAWLSYNCFRWLSCSARTQGTFTKMIYGYDPQIVLLKNNDPNANTANSGGQRADILGGINIYLPFGKYKANRLAMEYGLPVYQNVNGIQMNAKGIFYAGGIFTF